MRKPEIKLQSFLDCRLKLHLTERGLKSVAATATVETGETGGKETTGET